jgi:hypothetical protein
VLYTNERSIMKPTNTVCKREEESGANGNIMERVTGEHHLE